MTQPLRVVQVIARMNVGGPAVLIASAVRGMDPAEFDVRLITGYCEAGEADYLDTQAPDVPVERLEGLGRSIKPWSDLSNVGVLARRLRQLQPQVIHTHTAKAGVVGRIAARLSRVDAAVVHTYHGHLLQGYFSPAKTRAIVALERMLASQTDRLVAVGAGVRDDLLAAGIGRPEQYDVIAPGVELGALPDKTAARVALGLDPARPLFTMLGRVTGIKRPDRFADAVATVRLTHPEASFVVAGSGDLEDELRRRVQLDGLPIRVLGWRSDVETIIGASDALVLTSDNEGTPLSLIQAGLAGLPVVATDVGAVGDVVIADETGILCSPSASAVAAGIAALLDDPAAGRRLGGAARTRMESEFSVPRMLEEHAHLYRSVWGARQGRA